jgi:hypothetical protein
MLPSFLYFCNKVVYQLLILAFRQILRKNFIFLKNQFNIGRSLFISKYIFYTTKPQINIGLYI